MNPIGILLANIGVLLIMVAFAGVWNLLPWLWRSRQVSQALHAYAPSRAEWSAYYWRRARTYLVSYALVLAVLLLLPMILRRRASYAQIQSFLYILPGLIGYFVLASLVPARFTLYPEGFSTFALIPFLPGRRDRARGIHSDFRVGFRPWHRYHDAVPAGDALIVRGEITGAELVIPRGQRDRLLGLAREGLKRARDERRRTKREAKRGKDEAS